jgi:tetratricopeptide (TPR) repeat protein
MHGMDRGNRIFFRALNLSVLVLGCLALAGGARAQSSSGTGAQTQTQQQNGAKPAPAAPATDPAEEAAFKAFFDLKASDSEHQIQAGEQFLQKYPQSHYRATVYSRLTQAYYAKQELDKMFAEADKALELNPDDYTVLVMVGWVIPHGTSGGDPESDKKLDEAERYSKHALELLPTIAKPVNISDADFVTLKNQALATGHSGLGLVYFRRSDFEKSAPELLQATQLVPNPDPTDLFVLGVDYQQLKRYSEAQTVFEQCGKISGGLQQRCQQSAEQAKKLAATQLTPPKP